ncbi:MAG: MmgE/PrpD family protein [Proteobacteria bacterium]|nr:MmgE/PrpD family protein [Pseudomonadota bacterium]MBU2228142.1 MmgE/PrpD family protein [Pseudomonadota bacterium]MBU2262463.1 MmgE/PrpD family protein [Pseudomonadota bacterium]
MLTQKLAEFVIDTKALDVPQEALDDARDALIDTIGCGLAGTLDDVCRILVHFLRAQGGNAQATVWGVGFATTASDAAFANGVLSHVLDYDDTHSHLRGHPSAALIPAILAVGEFVQSSGIDALAAHVIGMEVAGKLGRALGDGHYLRGWHATATVGVFAAAAAAARLLGLSVDQMRHALGIAASESSGLLRNFGTMTKPFNAGHAAKSGVIATMLAKRGFTADTCIFDGKDGFLSAYGGADGQPLGELLDRLAQPWEVIKPGLFFKRWPCCYCNHRSIGGLLQMIPEHGLKPDEIEAVEIGFPPGSDAALISKDPRTGLQGKFSIEYVAAATLLDGKVTLESFTDEMVNRPEVRRLMQKVRRYPIDDSRTFAGTVGYNDLTVKTARGEFKLHVDKTPGSPVWPVSAAERDEKFLDCAGRVLSGEEARRLLEMLLNCQSLTDVGVLARATAPPQANP